MVKTLDVPPRPCLGCGKINDAASVVEKHSMDKPGPGDVTVCIHCGHIMIFAHDLTVRNPTDAEIRLIAGDRRILAIQRARKKVKL